MRPSPRDPAAMLPRVLGLLLANGQTTERAVATIERLGRTFGTEVKLIPGWGHTWLHTGAIGPWEPVHAPPVGIDMRKVAATMRLADSLCAGQTSPGPAASVLTAIEALPP